MSFDWPLKELQLIANEVTVGYVGTMASEYVEFGIPFLRSLNIDQFNVNKNDLKFITPEFHKRIKKSSLHPGDVAIVRTGKPGTCAVIPEWLQEANCSDLVIVRCGKDIRPRFLCYWINSIASHHIDSHTVGAVQQHFNVGAAKKMKVAVPDIVKQDQVIELLGGIDDRINLLRETNKTLETIAQAIFKSWFVDFDPVRAKQEGREPEGMDADTAALFPDSFEESEIGLIPKGWKVGLFGELAHLHKGSINPLNQIETFFEHYSLPAFDKGQMPINEAGVEIKSNKTSMPVNSVLLSKLNPHIPRVWLPSKIGKNAVCSTEFLVFIPAGGASQEFIYCYFTTAFFKQLLCQLVTGTSNSHQRVKPDAVSTMSAFIPSVDILKTFGLLTNPIFERIKYNRQKTQTLTQLRDTLLPRLISGQLRLPDTESIVKEATA